MKKHYMVGVGLASLMLTACEPSTPESGTTKPVVDKTAENAVENKDSSSTQHIEQLFKQTTHAFFGDRSLTATLFGLSAEDAGGKFSHRLEDYTPEKEQQFRAALQGYEQKLKHVALQNVDTELADNVRVMANLARYYSGAPGFDVGYIDGWMGHSPFIVNQINGPTIDIPNFMQNSHVIHNLQDAEDYIQRLHGFKQLMESIRAKLMADAKQNWLPPKVLIEKALHFLDGFTKTKVSEHGLVSNFVEKLSKVEGISAEDKQKLIKLAEHEVEHSVYPGYRLVAEAMRKLLPQGRAEAGIWAQPNGETFYRDAVKQLGDTNLSPEAIHQIGLDEVKRITAEMDRILLAQGYKEGTVGERMTALNEEPRFLYEDSDEGRAQLLKDLNTMIEEINVRMPELFATKPPYPVEVRRIPIATQDGEAGGRYTPPTLDGSVPGIYWINLRDMKANPRFDLKTLTYHEANPGHHWQIALNMSLDSLPVLRRIAPYNAYVEGWALYSELVAWEMGMYKDDPFGDLGRLKAELFRAVRLVVDTGLHYKKWTREEAIDYMEKTTGTARSDVVAEIERYMAWPGQALGYKLGMLKIVDLRNQAKQALGDKFDIRQFHDLVLLGGAMPMRVLEEKVDSWIKAQL
ncbi:DUF885 family protein [Pleionea sp. CnH1-48]|uniref:DUF885 domain-containing protein n=1 Tax=Pleionea sp. CnH1-48 TaxID=2954494 RepID=UPI002096DCBB|nr:DUF885 domain-containing protein [Pleionea sp. CnH1-48]MCO7227330.1 DUF885 domain-containing protein [Pleionea sp. CnH1-48]